MSAARPVRLKAMKRIDLTAGWSRGAAAALAFVVACSTHERAAASDAGGDGGISDAGSPDAGADAGNLDAGACSADAGSVCDGLATVVACSGGSVVHTACPIGESCIGGACAGSCTDACNLGDTDAGPDGGLLTCRLIDAAAQGSVDAGPGLADRARLYNSYLRGRALPAGQIAQLEFTSPALSQLASYNDVGDSAIFTGTYLAAEAWRYETTKSPDALANAIQLVNTIHMLWNVSGSPGWLARFAIPANSPSILTSQFSPSAEFDHFDGSFNNVAYDWKGNVSRDQYQGVLLGDSIAYDAIADESVRDLIRGDVVTFAQQLMLTRSLCPTINGVACIVPIQTQYVVVTDKEPLSIVIDTSNSGNDSVTGALLFTPKPFNVYPDPTVAIQLAAAFEVALQVTRDAPAWSAQYQAIDAFVSANLSSWLQVATDWVDTNNVCNGPYYGNNIAFEPMFNLARLTTDPGPLAVIQNILAQNMWSLGVDQDKNSWFAYIYAANTAANSDRAAAIKVGNTQLMQFTPPPRVHIAVTGSAAADPSCPADANAAIDVGARPIGDFEWQRDPKQLSDPGDPSEVYPGVDFLAAYWLARQQAFLPDDTPSRCTQWLP